MNDSYTTQCSITRSMAILLLIQFGCVQYSVADASEGPELDFTATYRYSHKPSNTVLDEARLRVSESGIRIDQIIDKAVSSLIANFETNRLWFLDRERQLVHEVPMNFVSSQALDEPIETSERESSMFGFIQYEVCSSLSAQFIENINQHGEVIEHWACVANGEVVEQQWFNRDYGVVELSMTIDGFVSELYDLRERQFNADYFMPPTSYRMVSIDELIHDAMPIGSYVENTSVP